MPTNTEGKESDETVSKSTVGTVFGTFFGIGSHDNAVSSAAKVALAAVKRAGYVLADYWLSIVSAWIVGVMTYFGFGFWQISAVMWAYDLTVAFMFLYLNEKTRQDITLAEGFRRAVDALHARSKVAGILLLSGIVARATIWDGPEQIVIFFRKELKTIFRMSALLVVITSFQAIFWTWVYGLGYEGVSELIRGLFGG